MDLLKEYIELNDPKNFKCSEECAVNSKCNICPNCSDYEECSNNNPDFCMHLNRNLSKEENLKICKQCRYIRKGDEQNEGQK